MPGIPNTLLTMQIQETNFGMYKQLCLINKEKKIRLCVLPELGGMLQSLDIRRNKEWVPILWTSEYPIEFIMGSKPSEWGTNTDDLPPSMSDIPNHN